MTSIHDFESKMDKFKQKLGRSSVHPENRKLILEFDVYCVAGGLSLARRWKLCEYLYVLGTRYLTGPWHVAKQEDIWKAVGAIEANGYAPWTRHDFKVALKKVFKFIVWGHEGLRCQGYPECVAGISTQVKKREQVRIQAADILSEEEIEKLLTSAANVQERALFTLMYELGARVGEIGPMRVGDISRDQYSYLCDLNGKTGPRSVRVIRGAGPLTAWLNSHPEPNNPEAFLWTYLHGARWRIPTYYHIQRMMKKLAGLAKIQKRVHPHLLRHSRITHVLAGGLMNEAQAKVFFGLTADSKMMAVYSHLIAKDANDAVLRMYGIARVEKASVPAPRKCGMCREFNEAAARFCAKCGYALGATAAEELKKRQASSEEMIERFLQRPDVRELFKKMVHDEMSGGDRDGAPPRPAVRPRPPTAAADRDDVAA